MKNKFDYVDGSIKKLDHDYLNFFPGMEGSGYETKKTICNTYTTFQPASNDDFPTLTKEQIRHLSNLFPSIASSSSLQVSTLISNHNIHINSLDKNNS